VDLAVHRQPEQALERKLGILREHCEVVGRDMDEIEISTGVSVRGMGSLAAQVRDEQYGLGVRLFEAAIEAPDFDLTVVRELLTWRDSQG